MNKAVQAAEYALWWSLLTTSLMALWCLGRNTFKHVMPSENVLTGSAKALVASLPAAVVALAIISTPSILVSAMYPHAPTNAWLWLWTAPAGLGALFIGFLALGLLVKLARRLEPMPSPST
ncbi:MULTISPECIES: hypothetical protein [unclassified Glutamicibacter]|uniref:hypothetical protein n=1 Tax=unclassified Glutamicibacter TaxID=2627139 RepID=UPI000F92681D